jgi:hypothetical protein
VNGPNEGLSVVDFGGPRRKLLDEIQDVALRLDRGILWSVTLHGGGLIATHPAEYLETLAADFDGVPCVESLPAFDGSAIHPCPIATR